MQRSALFFCPFCPICPRPPSVSKHPTHFDVDISNFPLVIHTVFISKCVYIHILFFPLRSLVIRLTNLPVSRYTISIISRLTISEGLGLMDINKRITPSRESLKQFVRRFPEEIDVTAVTSSISPSLRFFSIGNSDALIRIKTRRNPHEQRIHLNPRPD